MTSARTDTLETVMALSRDGWTMVYLSSKVYHIIYRGGKDSIKEMFKWLDDNCADSVVFHAAAFAFRDPADAIIFRLRWS